MKYVSGRIVCGIYTWNVGKREVINNCLNFGRMVKKIVMDWSNRKILLRRPTENISR